MESQEMEFKITVDTKYSSNDKLFSVTIPNNFKRIIHGTDLEKYIEEEMKTKVRFWTFSKFPESIIFTYEELK